MKFQDMQYTRISQEELEKGFEDLIRRQKEAKSGQEQFEIHREYYRFYGHIETMFVLCSIRHSVDTTDEFYEKENDYCDELAPILEKYNTLYGETLYDSPYRAELEKKIGAVAFKNIELRRRAFDEKLIPLMQEENQLSTRYDKLIATAKIPFEGEIYNLSLMRKFTVSPDREVRKAAQKAISDWFLSVTEEIDEIYDRMVKNRTEQARILGFENYIPLGYLRMQRNSYGREEVENFRRQVKERFVPFVGEIQEKRRQRLGLDHLYGYDNGVFFPEGNPEPKGTPEE
ncbi:MAG: M3 family oligoendopeptidase, partial [Lachnospiraceae bacterium]|nr:M3 family oligoendopeptidase [Lachnospiraceae bacterium]